MRGRASAEAPHSPEFRKRRTAVAAEIDELGHVSNVVYLQWVLEIAKAHSAAVGWDHQAYVRSGAIFVVRKHEIEYLASAYVGDEIDVTTWVESFRGASTTRRTRITRSDGKELAHAETHWVYVTMDTGRPRRISPSVSEAFTRAVSIN